MLYKLCQENRGFERSLAGFLIRNTVNDVEYIMHHETIVGSDFQNLSIEQRTIALKKFFVERDVTPPGAIGDLSKGIPEITEVKNCYTNGKFFADVEVMVQWAANAEPLPFVMRSNVGGAGAVFIPVVGDKVALVRQWRPCLGKTTWEIPRGFSESWETGGNVGPNGIPKGFRTALGELAEEVGDATNVVPTFLGKIAENTGSTTTSPDFWLLSIERLEIGPKEEGVKVKLVSWERLDELIGSEVADCHSLTAILLAKRMLNK